MKTPIITTILLSFCTAQLFAQSAITFTAGGQERVQYTTDGINLIPVPASQPVPSPSVVPDLGQITLDFMAAPLGTPLTTFASGVPDFTAAWSETTFPNISVAPIPGAVSGLNVRLPASDGPAGGQVEFSIVAWTGTATTWNQALLGGATSIAWTGSALSGGALDWAQITGPIATPAIVAKGSGAFKGLALESVPDAAPTLLLGIFSAAGLLLFRTMANRRGTEVMD